MPPGVVEICQNLIRRNSVNPPGNELQAASYAAGIMDAAGLETRLVHHGPDRASLLACLRGSSPRIPVILSAHLDTVPAGSIPWTHDPFGGEISGGRIWGRGASDMKGGMAVILSAACTIAAHPQPPEHTLLVALTAGEERDCLGALSMLDDPGVRRAQAVLVAEPSGNEVFIAEKGALWLELSTRGKTAHGSMPHLGINALRSMLNLLQEFDRMDFPFEPHPLLDGFSVSLNTLHAGSNTNVVPDACSASLDLRTVPGQDHAAILRQVNSLISRLSAQDPAFQAEVRVLTDRPPVSTSPQDPFVQALCAAVQQVRGAPPSPQGVHYFSDAAVYSPALGIPMAICGPGEAGMAHQPDEYVEIEKLQQGVEIYTTLLEQLLF